MAEHQLVLGVTVRAELRRVLRQKMGVPGDLVRELDAFLQREAIIAGRTKTLPVTIRDKPDAAVLAEAVAGGAEVLVTGDRDLLEVAGKLPIRILTPRGLWEQLRNDAASSS